MLLLLLLLTTSTAAAATGYPAGMTRQAYCMLGTAAAAAVAPSRNSRPCKARKHEARAYTFALDFGVCSLEFETTATPSGNHFIINIHVKTFLTFPDSMAYLYLISWRTNHKNIKTFGDWILASSIFVSLYLRPVSSYLSSPTTCELVFPSYLIPGTMVLFTGILSSSFTAVTKVVVTIRRRRASYQYSAKRARGILLSHPWVEPSACANPRGDYLVSVYLSSYPVAACIIKS